MNGLDGNEDDDDDNGEKNKKICFDSKFSLQNTKSVLMIYHEKKMLNKKKIIPNVDAFFSTLTTSSSTLSSLIFTDETFDHHTMTIFSTYIM